MRDFDFYEKRRGLNVKRIVVTIVLVLLVAAVVWYVDGRISSDEDKSESDKIYSANDDSKNKKETLPDTTISEPSNENYKEDKKEDSDKKKDKTDKDTSSKKDEEKNKVKPGKTVPESKAVDDDYFEDAVFIGDSRVEGLMMLSGITKGTFFVEKGLTVKKMDSDKIAKVDGKSMTVYKALEKNKYKKVYIKTGINELGWVYSDIFEENYTKVIQKIKELQPDAVIYVQSIIHVSKEESDTSEIFKNEKIDSYNDIIKGIVEKEGVYYIDLNEAFTDDEGALIADAASDGIHLKSTYCKTWLDYLKTHTVQE